MENQKHSKSDRRTRWIVSLAKWLLPESEVIRLNDLLDEGMPPREFAWEVAGTIARGIQSATGRGFRLERTVLEGAVIYVPLWSAPLLPAIAAVIPVLVVLRIREAMIFPGDGSPGEMTADALVGASALLISQLLFWSAAPSLECGHGMTQERDSGQRQWVGAASPWPSELSRPIGRSLIRHPG